MDPNADDALFDITDFAAWSRALYRRSPPLPRSSFLFDSSLEEPAEVLADVVRQAFTGGITDRYASVFGRGNPFAIRALVSRYGVDEDRIVCSAGASNAVSMVLNALVARGDRVLIERPGFDVLTTLAAAAGAEVSFFDRRGADFQIDPDDFRRALQTRPRLVIISNLHNPSGHLIARARLRELADIAAGAGATILVDEVYADFAGAQATCAATLGPNVISVNSLTKVFGLFSLRFGWIIAEPALARRIARANAAREFGVSKLTHAIAACVLENPAPFETHWRGVLKANRPVMEAHARAMTADGLIAGPVPEYGCIYFPDIVGVPDTRELARDIWAHEGILLAPGEFFGAPGHIRLGFGLGAAALNQGLGRLHAALGERRRTTKIA